MSGPVRGVLFDKDGTLTDFKKTWVPGLLSAARHLAVLHALDTDPDALTRAAGGDPQQKSIAPGSLLAQGTATEVAELWCALAPGLPALHETAASLDAYWLDHAARTLTPACDLEKLFSALRARDIQIGIVTNDAERGARDLIETFGLRDQVDFVAGYDSGHRPKPAPDMIEAFLRARGMEAADTVMIGDSKADMEAGRAAGCRATIGVLTGATPEPQLADLADFVIADAGHLPSLLFSGALT
ncbi:HAD family hydrolase [Nisaea sp.]|uniref:HAD family hydrolase n=1 Tax=Nisaea sp. TaxID=2024842 RepID=UPI0032EFB643